MLDVLDCLDEIGALVDQLLNDSPSDIQRFQLHQIRRSLPYQKALYPELMKLIAGRTVWEGVGQMSTEWRTPITTIMVYAKLSLEHDFWPLSQSQRTAIERIRELANQLWEWSNQGHPPL